ncbi:MAG: DUF1850 domain-containing protein [Spirochaetales bacterium]|nr:DUF1850 domain-containing protein [Spirochaetales bacterium]
MKSKALVLLPFVLILVMGTLLFSYLNQGPGLELVLSDQETGQVLFSHPVREGDEVTFHWIHSFEHIPWNEKYSIEADDTFVLHTISVAGFGAGIPENKGVVAIEDGMVVMRSIEEQFNEIRWIHSQTALVSITLGPTTFITGKDVEHHLPVELSIKGTRTLWPRSLLTK